MTAIGRRPVLALLAAGATVAVLPRSATADLAKYQLVLPEPTGRFRIGVTELHLVDDSRADVWVPSRRRELMVSIWYPAVPSTHGSRNPYAPAKVATALADEVGSALGLASGTVDYAGTPTHARTGIAALGRHPVIVYSPGFGTSRLLGTQHVEDLVSRGYVVVTMDHTGEAPVEFPDGRVSPVVAPVEELERAVAVRVADTKYVLGQLARLARGVNPDAERRSLPRGLGHALDLRKVGMLGYSLGGFTAAQTMLTDRRIAAGVDLDGTLQYAFPDGELSEVAKRGLDRPFLLFGGADHSHLSQPGQPMNDPSWTSFWAHQRGWKLNLRLPEGTHSSFADYQFSLPAIAKAFGVPADAVTGLLGTVDPARSVAAQRAYLAAYFDQFLKHRPQHLLLGESPKYPDVRFVR
ncbi:alpha/beta hydrolase family protein [Kribbella endophytica]